MKIAIQRTCNIIAATLGALAALEALAFNSGSTGADGALSPTANVTIQLPASGIFNYTTINIPSGVTVTFLKNATNTPVVMLASGDVAISGTINVSGTSAPDSNYLATDGQAGTGGVGGYDGGAGGWWTGSRRGGNGLGLGGGGGGTFNTSYTYGGSGGGGGYSASGGTGTGAYGITSIGGTAGPSYGSTYVQPLTGGSGGGGGGGSTSMKGGGGGGGGGAILIASSGTVTIASSGQILANGGNGGGYTSAGNTLAGCGGGGSGGAIRIVATKVAGGGLIKAAGGTGHSNYCYLGNYPANAPGGDGSDGRIRIEGEQIGYANSNDVPSPSLDIPAAVFLAGQPSLVISSVAGVAAPASPTGTMDITLPSSTSNPVTVVFTTSGIPVGSTINLTVTPTLAAPVTAQSGATTGTTTSATASASVTIPTGHNVFQASVSYTVVASLGDALRNFAGNERVNRVTLVATLGGPMKAKLTTVSGKEYDAPPEALRVAAIGG